MKLVCVLEDQEGRQPDHGSLESTVVSEKIHERIGLSGVEMLHCCQRKAHCKHVFTCRALSINFQALDRKILVGVRLTREETDKIGLISELIDC